MSFVHRRQMPLDYQPVSYAGSILRFRGPKQSLEEPYVLCLGGTECFGRFIHAPYAAQLDDALPINAVNMGVMNAGLDVILHDPVIKGAVEGAQAVVLQIPAAHNMNNRFYSVHPRRNDRFLRASTMLRTIYRDVDFTEFHFTRHLLTHLQSLSAERFGILVAELQTAWLARMKTVLSETAAPVHLLWISKRRPNGNSVAAANSLVDDPLFVTEDMLEEIRPLAASVTVSVPRDSSEGRETKGMFYAAREKIAAQALPGPSAHDDAARGLLAHLGPHDSKTPRTVMRGAESDTVSLAQESLPVISGTASKRSATRP